MPLLIFSGAMRFFFLYLTAYLENTSFCVILTLESVGFHTHTRRKQIKEWKMQNRLQTKTNELNHVSNKLHNYHEIHGKVLTQVIF